jgi:hypothetical protein
VGKGGVPADVPRLDALGVCCRKLRRIKVIGVKFYFFFGGDGTGCIDSFEA